MEIPRTRLRIEGLAVSLLLCASLNWILALNSDGYESCVTYRAEGKQNGEHIPSTLWFSSVLWLMTSRWREYNTDDWARSLFFSKIIPTIYKIHLKLNIHCCGMFNSLINMQKWNTKWASFIFKFATGNLWCILFKYCSFSYTSP